MGKVKSHGVGSSNQHNRTCVKIPPKLNKPNPVSGTMLSDLHRNTIRTTIKVSLKDCWDQNARLTFRSNLWVVFNMVVWQFWVVGTLVGIQWFMGKQRAM